MLKTLESETVELMKAYHLGEGRVLKTLESETVELMKAYHLGEGRVLKTFRCL